MGGMKITAASGIGEPLRWLAVSRVLEGEDPDTVADLLGVSERSVWRWLQRWHQEGEGGLAIRRGRGRPSKLSEAQAHQVLDWVEHSALEFGFPTDRWTAPRLAQLVARQLHVQMNYRYLNDWLRRHGVTPQIPQPSPRERDQQLIAGWERYQWPRIKKR
jgi:transposase